MSSGYFPLDPLSEEAKALARAMNEIEWACDQLRESIYCGDDGQFDNSASDGGSLALLGLAKQILLGEIDGYGFQKLKQEGK